MTIRDKRSQTFFIIAQVMVIAFSLYITQVDRKDEFFYHLDVVFLELFFIPIVLACLWMGLAGGLATSMGVALLLLPYLILHWEGLSASDLNRVLRVVVYFLASVTLGRVVLSQREEQKRAREAENLAAIGKSMAMVAHDIRTPLISIGGFSSLVLRHLDAGFPHRDKIEIVIEETRRLESMVREMLDYSKPLELNRVEGDIDELVKGTLALVQEIASKRGVELRCELSSSLRPAFLDIMRMKQVLVNLVTNAIEASPAGEAVTVKAYMNKKNLHVDVADCGCGIPPDKREDIFLPFFTTKKDGVGLGLDITKKIVESHGGYLEIVDNTKKGSIFKVVIPHRSGPKVKGPEPA
ncbi:MAG: sensor histidine kinase [Syntrophobacteraceae bacterium]